jgi:hypothetical protein
MQHSALIVGAEITFDKSFSTKEGCYRFKAFGGSIPQAVANAALHALDKLEGRDTVRAVTAIFPKQEAKSRPPKSAKHPRQ